MKEIGIGIIGGGLMGREVASAFARWCALTKVPVKPVLRGVADLNANALEWFKPLPGIKLLTQSVDELLASKEIDVIYAAVPHSAHLEIYAKVLESGKDLLAEKPFGVDLSAADRVLELIGESGRFVRCSSEFPFFPAVQRAFTYLKSEQVGRVLNIVSGFHHSSDLDPQKPANWKRSSKLCGEIGVMGDLGMHVCHVPFRLGWIPTTVYAQLQKGYPERPDGKGGMALCDTWDNATLHTNVNLSGELVPMRLEMKRLAPGATNTWYLEVHGTDGGIRYSTAEPKSLYIFQREPEQQWSRVDLGFQMAFPTVTGGIFEPGFPDVIQQMWASYLLEREGLLGDSFGCVTPDEARQSHRLFAAALRSVQTGAAENVER